MNDGEWWWMGAFKIWWTLNLQSDDFPSKKWAIWRGFGWVTVQFTPENSLGPKRTSSIHGFSDDYVSLGVDNSWKLPLEVWDGKSTQFSQKNTNHRTDRNSQNSSTTTPFVIFKAIILKPKKKWLTPSLTFHVLDLKRPKTTWQNGGRDTDRSSTLPGTVASNVWKVRWTPSKDLALGWLTMGKHPPETL